MRKTRRYARRRACPIEEALPGFKIHPLSEGWTPLQAFVLVKALDDEGDPQWSFRTSESFNLEELLGALVVQQETLRRKIVREWEDGDPDYTDGPDSH